jgi:hypothetical protein
MNQSNTNIFKNDGGKETTAAFTQMASEGRHFSERFALAESPEQSIFSDQSLILQIIFSLKEGEDFAFSICSCE